MKPSSIKIKVKSLEFFFHNIKVLDQIDLEIAQNTITAVTGPSGQGKSTFLMTLNRLWEPNPHARLSGKIQIRLGDRFQDIYEPRFKVHTLRRAVGMVFQTPNPLPMSIYKNIAFPLKLVGEDKRKDAAFRVEQALKHTFLWEEVKERLHEDARSLSGGQQQRLCMARAMILKPEVLLLDEPTASLDERAAGVIEDLLMELKPECTLILVSHYQDQVKRIADSSFCLSHGRMQAQW
jgi:phosphate transport system ATP-binding protein